ncbi:FAD-dependent oxidoreductase [Telmatospirillum siberiense]|uniref:FAD-dependent oxidoreductase n=2 Tax=Telmatospirillum siberiense TaxID=382514 RepID=A0A2N3PYC3_9PROT|nr:FAD-dependent oxidoreductase [Telmatospirillum siberiense]
MEGVLDVLVVGAGPAGLTAAYLLSKQKGLSISVIESNTTYVGGISRTEEYKGYLFDIGGHRFFSKSKEVEALWREILPDDFLDRPRSSRILYKRKFYSYPLRAFEALTNLGLLQSFLCVCSYAKARAFPNRHPTSFHQWVANQFGERLFGIFFKTYTEKVWGISCDALSADWAAQRIKGLNLATAILSAIGKSIGRRGASCGKGGCVVKTLIESFRYPRRGPGMMWEAARQKVLANGGLVEMGVTAIGFHRLAELDLWDVSAVRADGSRCVYRTRRIISSAPLRDVVQAVQPVPDGARLAAKLSYRDFITVAVMLNRRPAFDDNWIYIHDPSVKVGRVQNFSSWSPEMVPDSQSGCLGLEYFCFEGDELWTTADADLVALAVKELSALGLASPDQVIDGRVVRQPKAYPVYDADYKEIVESIKTEFVAKYPGLHFVGRNGMHKYNNQDHAMMTAMLTVKNIINGNDDYDVWLVNEDAEYHEEIKGA